MLKVEILRWNSKFSESQYSTLLEDEHLGDRTPSRIRELSNGTRRQFLLEAVIFLEMPNNVHSILAFNVEASTVDRLASAANKILECSNCSTSGNKFVVTVPSPLSSAVQSHYLKPRRTPLLFVPLKI